MHEPLYNKVRRHKHEYTGCEWPSFPCQSLCRSKSAQMTRSMICLECVTKCKKIVALAPESMSLCCGQLLTSLGFGHVCLTFHLLFRFSCGKGVHARICVCDCGHFVVLSTLSLMNRAKKGHSEPCAWQVLPGWFIGGWPSSPTKLPPGRPSVLDITCALTL